jgi:hypothetical protein
MPELKPGSVEWWLARLTKRLDGRQKTMQRLLDYYEGRHPLIFATDRFREAFGEKFGPYVDNFVSRIVDAVGERLFVDGFRFGNDEGMANEAWRIWQENRMDAGSSLLFREALIKREASIIVWAGDELATPRISVEDPMQVVVETASGNRRRRLAALKRWVEDTSIYATLYLPNAIYKFTGSSMGGTIETVNQGTVILGGDFGTWTKREIDGEAWPLKNPLGVVPVVPLINRPNMYGEGRSELEPVIPLQDAINKTGADMLVASEFAAFRQRWATGLDIPEDPITGKPIPTFAASVERLWTTDDKEVTFGEFGASDLGNYVTAIEMQVQHLASISGIPVHYLLNTGVVPSGESQTAVESPLVNKVRDRQVDYSDPLEEVMQLVFLARDEPERARQRGVAIWRDPERRTPSEFVDSLVKELALGIPPEILWEKRGYTKQEIDRIKAIKLRDGLLAPPAPVPPPVPAGGRPSSGG